MDYTATAALKFAWGGEIYGMSFFQHFIDHDALDDHPWRREIWHTLYRIEMITENYLRQRLAAVVSLDETEQQQLREQGVHEAGQWLHLSWQPLCVQMRDWVAPWQEKYADWYQQAQQTGSQQSWQAEFNLVHVHESAIFTFWQGAAQTDDHAYARLQTDASHLQTLAASTS